MTGRAPLAVSRDQILAFRRRVGSLDERLPAGRRSLERAAFAGLQDSVPRSAVLSLHARVRGVTPSSWEDPALVQVWGLRYTTYVIPAKDRAVFTLGRYPDDPRSQRVADDLATRLAAALGDRRVRHDDAAEMLGLRHPNALRYAGPTGTVLIRWAGARQPDVWSVPKPATKPWKARLELLRRYLRVLGPSTAASFATWAGVSAKGGDGAFEAIAGALVPVRTPIGDAWLLARDEETLRAPAPPPAAARLLPSGDTYYLLQGRDRELLVPNAKRRAELWTSRVWPGAVLLAGEVAGTWRRAQHVVTVDAWRRLTTAERDAIEEEAVSLPLPDLRRPVVVRWEGAARP
jgi:hypothetical protein